MKKNTFFLKYGIGAGQLYRIEKINYKLPRGKFIIKALTGTYKGGIKMVSRNALHRPKKGFEWCFDRPSKVLNIDRLIKELAYGDELQQRNYLRDLKKFAPMVYRRFKNTDPTSGGVSGNRTI